MRDQYVVRRVSTHIKAHRIVENIHSMTSDDSNFIEWTIRLLQGYV
jgi:hypothetical protein